MTFLSKTWAADVPAAIYIYIFRYQYRCRYLRRDRDIRCSIERTEHDRVLLADTFTMHTYLPSTHEFGAYFCSYCKYEAVAREEELAIHLALVGAQVAGVDADAIQAGEAREKRVASQLLFQSSWATCHSWSMQCSNRSDTVHMELSQASMMKMHLQDILPCSFGGVSGDTQTDLSLL